MASFRSRWTRSKFQLSRLRRLLFRNALIEGIQRKESKRPLRFENLESRNLMAAWIAQGPFSATNGQVENLPGNDPIVGAVHAVLAHPTNANILYVGATNGGVWKTTDALSASPRWTTSTDTQSSISIGALAFDQADLNFQTLWAGNGRYSSFGRTGGSLDGLMRSNDGGATWTRVTGGGVLIGKNISGIVANGSTIVVSVNTGTSAANTNHGIFRSTNGGASFSQVNDATASAGLPYGRSFDLVADPRNPLTLYTSNALTPTAGDQGVYKSINGGATWSRVSNAAMNALFTNNTSNLELAAGRSGEVYAAIINAGNLAGLFRSPDGGLNWTQMDTPSTNENGTNVGLNPRGVKGPLSGTPDEIAGGQGSIHFSITADPTNPNIVYVGGDRQPTSNGDNGTFPNSLGATDYSGRLFRGDASRPAGSQFVHLTHRNNLGAAGGGTASSSSPHADSRDLTFDANGNLIEGDDGGVYRRTSPQNNTGDWFSVIGNLQVTEMHDVAYDSISNVILSGNQDTGTTYQPTSGAGIWDSITTADGGDVAVDELALAANGQSIRYSSFQNLGFFGRRVYNAAGTLVSTTIPPLTVVGGGAALVPAFKTTIQTNAVAGSRLVIQGLNSIYESLNQGTTITEVGPGFGGSEDAIVYGGKLNGVANPDVLWVGDGTNVALRTAAGSPLTLTPTQPATTTIRDLVVDPNTYTSVAIASANGIQWSTNAGTTWRNITGNLSLLATDFRSLAFIPDTIGSIVVGTSQGIFATSMAALGQWFRLGTDFPNVPVYELEYDEADNLLVAGTLGRGAWALPIVTAEINSSGVEVQPPRLLSIAPNSGKIFDPNAGNISSANVLSEAPRELTFRFSGSQQLDPTSLRGIRITRSGGDDNFDSGNEVVVTPTFLGFGDSSRVVIARFGEALPDDRYKIEVLAVDENGLPKLRSIDNQTLLPRFAGTDRDTYYMNLELGGKIVAVVPQPVVRQLNGSLTQERNKIEVYFNNDDLNLTLATTPEFYQLILTKDSVTPNDDSVFTPSSVSYDAAADKAVLTFASNIDSLAGGSGTFRLRIGSNRTVATSLAPQSPTVSTIAADVGDTLASASTVLGTLGAPTSRLIDTNVTFSVTNQLNLNFPGSNFEPGHRDIQDENHLGGGPDVNPAITKILFNFSDGRSYGNGSNGQPLFSSITSDQKQRIREIFEFYSAQAGIDVVETQAEGLTIVVGDLFPLNNPPAPFTPAGIAGGGLAIMNGALSWNNGLGEDFFDVSLHEIGHLLGLVHTYELPSGTVMGSTGQLDSGNPIEFSFPGDNDVAHLQYLHRPDNRDVDIYKFDLTPGQKGKIVAETIAERLSDASELDTYLTLFKRDATGLHIIAINDNYFSDDSLIRAEVTGEAGVDYFIAVTSRGNEDYNPQINGSGSGGTSQGRYQLRVDYQPSEVNQILDTSGTPLDGDGDGLAGGEFNFWFRAASPVGIASVGAPKTIFVDKDGTPAGANGSLSNPYQSIPSALAVAQPGDIVRLVGSVGIDRTLSTVADNLAYEIGDGGPGKGVLSDGPDLTIPRGVSLMIDAGAILKIASTEVLVGSSDASSNRSGATIQVLGTPSQSVVFTSYFDESFGIDTNLLDTSPDKGNWGGIEIRNDADREQGRREPELDGIFLNYIAQADIRYGGGTVGQGSQGRVVNPIHLSSARPTLLYNRISQSADAGISADPNSFEETLFTEPRYQFAALFTPDYSRVGPDIHSQQITDSSTNGLFIRIDTLAGQKLKTLNVAARLDDADIVYTLGENLVIEGTPGGSFKETVGPNLASVLRSVTIGGSLAASTTYDYRMTFIDRNGNEGLPSVNTLSLTTTASNRSISFGNLPQATNDFVGRRLYRKTASSTTWDLVAELDRNGASYTDNGTSRILATNVTLTSATSLQRARRDASLVVDPGVVIKLQGSRIEVGIGAQLIAEGTSSKPIIFTSRKDDRYGAGATFDTNNDLGASSPVAGDWSGIYASHLSTISIDSALITFGGGSSNIANGSATFNAIEVYQATARIANSILESNAAGNTQAGSSNRDYHGSTDASVIHVVASQPVIFNNTIRNNSTAAAISIDANSMKAISLRDFGRSTGANQRTERNTGNLGPFVLSNELGGNALNGMRVRGATLTTEAVWDDTDIVHILQSQVVVPDFHTYGGLRLQSKVDESLVVKLIGANAGITASGRPLDIPSRIGGSLQIIGAPGFPVVLTSISDDSTGAGFDWEGRPMLDTNNDGASTGTAGDWRSIRLNPYSNDRNLDTLQELESDPVGDRNRNDLPAAAQNIGLLANNLNGGDENVRLGFTIQGTIAAPSDLDVYKFTATAGTSVWFDIDRSGSALDSVIELVSPTGQIIAQSNNSFDESIAGSVYSDSAYFTNNGGLALPMNQSSFVAATDDFQTINPLDAGLRIQLPGTQGTTNTYLIRVRSSNLAPGDAASKLQNLSQVSGGLSVGPYRLQVRLQQEDEVAGSTIRFADIRYATTGIEVLGLPGHSPLTSEISELSTNSTDPATAQDLGNIANADRAAISVAGNLSSTTDVDWFRFRVSRDSIQSPGGLPLGTVIDVDYADGLGRPDTTLWVYRVTPTGNQLVLIGTDSNIADDRDAPASGNSAEDLTRGSFGPRDPFIGVQELPDGEYIIGITPSSRVEQQFRQFSQSAATNPLLRLEPISSAQRISEDHFEASNFPIFDPFSPPPVVAKQVSFAGNANAVPLNLSDVTLFVSQNDDRPTGTNRSRVLYANPLTGVREADVNQNYNTVYDIAVSPAGTVVGAEVELAAAVNATRNDANIGFLASIKHDGTGATRINSGIQTFEAYDNGGGNFAVTQARNGTGNNATPGVGTIYTALSFADDTSSAAANPLALFAIGQRGDRLPFDVAVNNGTNNAVSGVTPGNPLTAPYKNILYRLATDNLQAVSPTGIGDRTGDRRARGTGTDVREFGVFAEIGPGNYQVTNAGQGDSITVTRQASGDIVGLAQVGNFFYGVTNTGELWRMATTNTGFTNGFRTGATLVAVASTLPAATDPTLPHTMPTGLTGLTRGPRNVEGGVFADMLFGTTATGQIYAFDVAGTLQPVFPGAATSVVAANAADQLGTVNGIDFGALDVNLWHTSNIRGADAGHGRPVNFDSTKGANQAGNNSLYFGFEPTGNNANVGNWGRIYNASAAVGTYDFAGGAAGAIVSNPIDLRSYSVDDKPMLYFTYRADTDNANGPNTDNVPMTDAFRVYGEMPDGTSVLLATNNATDNGNYLDGNNEVDSAIALNTDVFGTDYKPQILFDALEAGDTGGWRQARIPLAAMAGLNDVKLRFEFSTGGTFNAKDALRGGFDLTIVAGNRIQDGEHFSVTGNDATGLAVNRTLEFDLGLSLNLPSGASIVDGDQLTVQGRPFRFRDSNAGPIGVGEIGFVGTESTTMPPDTPSQIATKVAAALTADGFTVSTNTLSPNILNISSGARPVTAAGPHNVVGLDQQVIVGLPGASQQTVVLTLPAGLAIPNGAQITIQNMSFTFQQIPTGAPGEILYAVTDTPASIAQRVAAALRLPSGVFNVVLSEFQNNRLIVSSGTTIITPAGPHSVVGLAPTVLSVTPSVAVPITQAMTAAQVRDAVRTALAATFNAVGQTANLNVWKFYNDTLQLFSYGVDDPGPLSLGQSRGGDSFGPTTLLQASSRATNNVNEGIFVDDIVIALAERGEMVVGATTATPVYQNDGVLTDGGYVSPSPIASGTYQIEIRTAADYIVSPNLLGRTFDSNDRLAKQLALVVSSPSTYEDGATFTLSDGVKQFVFEFDVLTSAADRAAGVQPGNVAVAISPSATTGEIAEAIRDAINSAAVQQTLRLSASLDGQVPNGNGSYLNPDLSSIIQLHGNAAADLNGSLVTSISGLTLQQFGTDSAYGEDLGDSNRRRDQGQIVISSNTVRNSSAFGIVVDNAVRDQSPGFADFLGDRPYPGSVRNLITENTSDLAPGVVVSNNIVASNTSGGIRISGDNTAGVGVAASNIARVFNNTVFGTRSGDRGIVVDERAHATILNNILSNLTTGVDVVTIPGFTSQTVLGSNIYQSNGTNSATGLGSNSIVLTATDPLFVNPLNSRFYLAAQSRAIDSSNSALAELGLLSQVKNSVFLPTSPLLAPDRDVTGVLRVDDTSVPSTGQGPNINIDRGAVERADTVRLQAFLVNPLDNDTANVDVDRNSTYVQLLDGNLDAFSILLTDDLGSGPDATTVLPESVIVTENGKQLVEGIDYVFGYNAGSNTIRLTPLAGLWRRDSVYEITLINKPTYRIDTGNGSKINDGDLYKATLPDGTTRTLEYDSGFVLNIPSTLSPVLADGQTITYQKAGGPTTTFEFNLAGDTIFDPSNTVITLDPTDTFLTIASKIETALASVVTGGNYPVKDLGLGRVHVGGALGDLLQVSNSFIALTGKPGVTPSITIQAPLNGGAGIADGQLFSIKVNAGLPVVFEFDNNNATTFGNRVIAFTASDTNDLLATNIATAIANAGLGFTPTTLTGGIVKLNEPGGAVLSLLTANLTSTGIPGGAIAIPFIPSSTFTASQVAIQTIKALNQIGQGVKVFSIGSGGILIEGLSGLIGANTSTPVVIRDIAGNPLNSNRSNALTQFTIAMPDVQFDFGDAPGVNAQTVKTNNGARHAVLPPDADRIFLGSSVDSESDGQPNATATGDDLALVPDDEDGVRVSGFFNTRNGLLTPIQSTVIPNTTVTVTSSGIGFVDAWIDWNRDGDFTDAGEQVITNQVVAAGDSTFVVVTPATASVGLTFLRVRLSTLGNLLSGGVGIGGEVEDHQIEVIGNTPPVAINDSYSISEDIQLTVPAPGVLVVLSNDIDADVGAILSVVDSNVSLPDVQPLVAPSFGTLVLRSDGSFDYTPNPEFFGIDTFVYELSDGVLLSLVPATVTITVTPVNDAPVVFNDSLSMLEDSPIDIPGSTFTANDFRGPFSDAAVPGSERAQTLTLVGAQLVSPRNNGESVQVVNGNLLYTPPQDYNELIGGKVLVRLSIQDSGPDGGDANPLTSISTLTLTINPANDAPIFTLAPPLNGLVAVDEDSSTYTGTVFTNIVAGPPMATDEVGQTLAFEIVSNSDPTLFSAGPSFSNAGELTFTPAANRNGTSVVGVRLRDGGPSGPTDVNVSSVQFVTISITAINDAPIFTIPTSIDVVEDQGSIISGSVQTQVPISLAGFSTSINPGPVGSIDEAGQTVTFDVVALEPSFFQVQPTLIVNLSNRTEATLTFTLAPHRNRDFPNGLNNLVTVVARDNGSSTAPDVNASAPKTFSINITQVNDPPIPGSFLPTVAEDSTTSFSAIQVLANALRGPVEAIDELTQVLTISQIASSSSLGGLVTPILNAGSITSFSYTPPANFVGTDIITYTITDDGVTPLSSVGTITITMTAVNDAPEFSPGPNVTVLEDSAAFSQQWVPLSAGLPPKPLIFAGPSNALDELNGSQTVQFEVTSTNAGLFTQSPAISADGVLTFTPSKDANGFALVTVTAIDSGSDVLPNINRSQPITFTINLTAVNDEPIFTSGGNVSVNEDTSYDQSWASGILAAAGLGAAPQTSPDESSQTISFVFLSNSNPGLFSTGPDIASDGRLSFTPALDKNGTAVVTVVARDSGLSSAPNDNESEVKTFTITVNAVNDAPIFTLPSSVDVIEDRGSIISGNIQTQVPVSLVGVATGIGPGSIGSIDEANQTVTFNVVALDPSFFQVQPTLVVNLNSPTEATLTFTLAPHRNRDFPNGLNNLIRVVAIDSGSNVAPDVNTSAPKTFSINITPVNDAPIMGSFLSTVLEDSTTNFSPSQILVNALRGPIEAVDEVSQNLSITQLATTSSAGGVITPILNAGTIISFSYTPPSNFIGTDTITYTATDDGVNPLSAVGTMTISVTAVNDPPRFSPGPNVGAVEDSAAYSAQWVPLNNSVFPPAPEIFAGPDNAFDELNGSQSVLFEVTTTNSGLFSQAPFISPTGVLTFTPAKDANGIAVVSVTAIDSGSDVLPNANRSQTVTFTITLSPINDEPVFTAGGNISVDEDSGDFNQAWATNIFPAAGLGAVPQTAIDEDSQTVSFTFLSNSNPGLFSAGPEIGADGKLSFTPGFNKFGTSVFTVVARDNGLSTSPNDNESIVRTFTINLLPFNDAPVGVNDNYTTTEDAPLIGRSADVKDNDFDPDGDSFSVIEGVLQSARGAGVILQADGLFEYDPRTVSEFQSLLAGQSLTDTFTYLLVDSNGFQSEITTVTITVDGRNDVPTAVNDLFAIVPNTTNNLNVLGNDTDQDTGFDLTSLQIGRLPTNGTLTPLPSGMFAYTPRSGFIGSDSFTYRVKDTTGLISNEAVVLLEGNRAPLASADTATVLRDTSIVINVLNNDNDPDGNGTINVGSVKIVSLPSNGTATALSDGSIRFTPSSGFSGTTTFFYTVADTGNTASLPALVTVNVVTSLYQNPRNRYDVNDDGAVGPIDALIVINDLKRNGTRSLSPTAYTPPPYIDVDGSSSVEPTDVLQIINFITRRSRTGSGEGESTQLVSMAAPSVLTSSLSMTANVLTVSQDQMSSSVGVQSSEKTRNTVVDGTIQSVTLVDSPDMALVQSSSTASVRKRLQQTDAVFADSLDSILGE